MDAVQKEKEKETTLKKWGLCTAYCWWVVILLLVCNSLISFTAVLLVADEYNEHECNINVTGTYRELFQGAPKTAACIKMHGPKPYDKAAWDKTVKSLGFKEFGVCDPQATTKEIAKSSMCNSIIYHSGNRYRDTLDDTDWVIPNGTKNKFGVKLTERCFFYPFASTTTSGNDHAFSKFREYLRGTTGPAYGLTATALVLVLVMIFFKIYGNDVPRELSTIVGMGTLICVGVAVIYQTWYTALSGSMICTGMSNTAADVASDAELYARDTGADGHYDGYQFKLTDDYGGDATVATTDTMLILMTIAVIAQQWYASQQIETFYALDWAEKGALRFIPLSIGQLVFVGTLMWEMFMIAFIKRNIDHPTDPDCDTYDLTLGDDTFGAYQWLAGVAVVVVGILISLPALSIICIKLKVSTGVDAAAKHPWLKTFLFWMIPVVFTAKVGFEVMLVNDVLSRHLHYPGCAHVFADGSGLNPEANATNKWFSLLLLSIVCQFLVSSFAVLGPEKWGDETNEGRSPAQFFSQMAY